MADESPRDAGEAQRPKGAPSRTRTSTAPEETDDGRERLHKFLASTGAGSRRECETFIVQGRVSVNSRTVVKMGVKVDPERDLVMLDGERVRPETRVYYTLNKPSGYICTNSDEKGRPRAVDLIRDAKRIYTVGRLDADSTGLVLLTNDGGIANIICHPRYRIEKRYQVHVRGNVDRSQVAKVEAGVWLAEGRSSPATVKPIGRNPKRGETILEMTLFEGRNREIRRVFARVGLTVRRLQRTSIGPLVLGDLKPGAYRRLRRSELKFVSDAEKMYLANQAAWDAELPDEERRPPRGRRLGGGRQAGGSEGPVGARDRQDARQGTPRQGGGSDGGGRSGGWGGGSFPKRGRRRPDPAGGGTPGGGTAGGGAGGPGERRRRRPAD